MGSEETIAAGLASGGPLPRGRHGIPPELIVANQRERLFSAAAELIAEKGYAALLVGDATSRAGVSRATFYKLFDDKYECVLAAQRWAFDYFEQQLYSACSSQAEWPLGVLAAVSRAVEITIAAPGEARLVLISYHAVSEPRLASEGLDVHGRLVELLEAGARDCPSARASDRLKAEVAVGAAMSMVGACLTAKNFDALARLKDALAQIVLAPYLGANEATRVSQAV
jgi:AcrR family transcriptional regulator